MIDGQEMVSINQEKYLEDIISGNAKIDENVLMRKGKGIGISNKILSILMEVSLSF